MKTFPLLETERLILRRLTNDDAPALFHYFSKDEVTEYYDLESFTKVEQAEDLIRILDERIEKEKGIRWGVTLKGENRVIGTCGFHNWSKDHFKAEVGYELTPEYWQKGIMTEVLNEVMKYGFEQLGLNRIEAFIDPANISSRKLLEKCGMKEEGFLRDYFFEKGRFVDAVIFAVLKKDLA